MNEMYLSGSATETNQKLCGICFLRNERSPRSRITKQTPVQKIEKAAVIGSGTMGGGIAMNFANAGIAVNLVDVSDEALDAGLQKIRETTQDPSPAAVSPKKKWMNAWL